VYADSSFILRLVTAELGSEEAIAEYRHLDYPSLFYLPLHDLEVRNAILQRAFYQRHSTDTGERRNIARDRDAAFGRLQHYIKRRALLEVTLDTDVAFACAIKLSVAHTQRLGARAIDILHVASAMTLESEVFLTTDSRQAQIARAEGLKLASLFVD
jgi:predicted nucleic acid-binding protein